MRNKKQNPPLKQEDIDGLFVSNVFILAQHEHCRYLVSKNYLLTDSLLKYLGTAEQLLELSSIQLLIMDGEVVRPFNVNDVKRRFAEMLYNFGIKDRLEEYKIYREDAETNSTQT